MQPVATVVPLKPPALLLAAVTLFLAAQPAQAHRLNADYLVLPREKTIKVESWFESGDSPKNATVQVYRSDQRLLVEGKLNAHGVFAFPYSEADTLRVVVSAPGGHRAELTISAKELGGGPERGNATKPGDGGAVVSADDDTAGRFADRGSRTAVKDVLLGVGLLLSLAGFVLGVRNARDLREIRAVAIRERGENPPPGIPPPATPPTAITRR